MSWDLQRMLIHLKRLYRTHKRVIVCLFVACICSIMVLNSRIGTKRKEPLNEEVKKMAQMQLAMNLQKEMGTGCELPKLDPFSEQAMAYSNKILTNVRTIDCDGPDWVTCHKDKCFVIEEILKTHQNVVCSYMDIIYVSDKYRNIDEPVTVRDNNTYMLNNTDHVKVNCTGVKMEDSVEKLSTWEGYKAGFRPIQLPLLPPGYEDNVNVLILGIDSTSHNGFIRGMPKSYKYLRENIKAVFMNGHNIVGDGTPAALFPLLTGHGEFEQPEELKKGWGKTLDDRKFIFSYAKNIGYRTAFFEDMPQIGTFQYRYNGFNNPPADHYLQPMLIEEFNHRTFKFDKHLHCIGGAPSYEVLLNLTAEFIELDGKKFGFTFLGDLAHDDFSFISNGDDDMFRLLKMIVDKNLLEDTLLIVMGDHGTRYEGVRNTQQGRLEERLPLVSVSLPARFPRRAHLALRHNAAGLTTHFDLHSTLLHVLGLSRHANLDTVPGANIPRAFSLLDEIPRSRTCSEAGILPHWCVCVKWYHLSQGDVHYQRVAKVFTDYLNAFTDEKRDLCVKRELKSIEWVLKQTSNDNVLRYTLSHEETHLGKLDKGVVTIEYEYYQVKIITSPGEAIYEGTLMYDIKTEFYHTSPSEVSRIDTYGNESACISQTDPHLNKFCYCREKSLETEADEYVIYIP